MPDLMSRTEARLREIYDFDNMKPMVSAGLLMYTIEGDERAFAFLNEIITLDYHKLEQIKNIFDFQLAIRFNQSFLKKYEVRIGFMPGKLAFFWGDMCRFSIRPNQTFEDLNIDIFHETFSTTELLNNLDYDKIYEKNLNKLREIMPSDMTTPKFFSTLNTNIDELIKSKITDNSIRYVGKDEFIEKYSNLTLDNNENQKVASLSFNLKPREIRKALAPFFSTVKIDEIVYALSLLAFYNIIKNPELSFKDIKGCISSMDSNQKFSDHYSCYSINIMLPNNERCRTSRYHDTFLNITTNDHFISYEKFFIDKDFVSFDGIQNVSKEVINDISGIFESNLGITREEINAKQLSLLLMMNS